VYWPDKPCEQLTSRDKYEEQHHAEGTLDSLHIDSIQLSPWQSPFCIGESFSSATKVITTLSASPPISQFIHCKANNSILCLVTEVLGRCSACSLYGGTMLIVFIG